MPRRHPPRFVPALAVALIIVPAAILAGGCAAPSGRRAAASISWTAQAPGTTADLRGLAAVDPDTCWAGGTRGTVLRTVDGGATWTRRVVPGGEALDFRSIAAVDADVAWIASAGTPARIYRTDDGGASWRCQLDEDDPTWFLDAIAAVDGRRAFVAADPIDGAPVILATEDGGAAWRRLPPASLPPSPGGEHAYAASGTCLTVTGERYLALGLGGPAPRVLASHDGGATWRAAAAPLASGPSGGVFSLAFADPARGVAVGGDYEAPAASRGTAAWTPDGGLRWFPAETLPGGYRSCVCRLPSLGGGAFLAVGTSGCDVTLDAGRAWFAVPGEGWNAVDVGGQRDGRVVGWAVGPAGRIGRFELPRP